MGLHGVDATSEDSESTKQESDLDTHSNSCRCRRCRLANEEADRRRAEFLERARRQATEEFRQELRDMFQPIAKKQKIEESKQVDQSESSMNDEKDGSKSSRDDVK